MKVTLVTRCGCERVLEVSYYMDEIKIALKEDTKLCEANLLINDSVKYRTFVLHANTDNRIFYLEKLS